MKSTPQFSSKWFGMGVASGATVAFVVAFVLCLTPFPKEGPPPVPSPTKEEPKPTPVTPATTLTPAPPPCLDFEGGTVDRLELGTFSEGSARGLDISHHNGPIPWQALRDRGITYVFIKASESDNLVDGRFLENWAMARRCRLLRGAYHFFRPDVSSVAQADHFLWTLGSDLGELPLVVDVETEFKKHRIDCDQMVANVGAFLDRIEEKAGMKIMIFTSHYFWQDDLCDLAVFGDHPLWVAAWKGAPRPFGAWQQWDFWQYSSNGQMNDHPLDLDRFRGSVEDLKRWANTRNWVVVD